MNPILEPLPAQPIASQPLPVQPASSNGINTDTIYSGVATLGKVNSYIYLFFGNLIGWPLLIYSIYLLLSKATPNELQTEEEAKSVQRKLGFILLAVSSVILLLVWGYWWLVKTYKPFAAYSGATAAVDWITPGFDLSPF
jgi:H+/Cl- antiporter ClcA